LASYVGLRALLAAFVALLACAAPPGASARLETIAEDELVTVQSGPARRAAALDELSGLGVDTVRALVQWTRVVPGPNATRRPAGLDPANPRTYPPEVWDPYDDLVRGARARGLDVLLSPAGPVPLWATPCRSGTPERRRTCKPSAREFEAFVTALARRFSGTYADENQPGVLPRVARWSVWNEPNQPGWLSPQYERVGGRVVNTAARRYRDIVRAATRGLATAGHGGDEVLLGETAPVGRTAGTLARSAAPPGSFMRDLLCLDRRGRGLRGRAARDRGCRGFTRLAVTGFAHHPYTRGGSRPPLSALEPDEITVRNPGRLTTLLDRAARLRRIPPRLPVLYTEFGFQTRPPDEVFGVPLARQADYLDQSAWLAFRTPRVRAAAQYKLVDDQAVGAFQSGLRFADGRAKPAHTTFPLPVWVTRTGSGVRVWGQVRPATDGARETVEIQRAARRGGAFATVARVAVASAKGTFLASVRRRGGVWRLRWTPAAGGAAVTSRTASPAGR
jgi:hypothetical protein